MRNASNRACHQQQHVHTLWRSRGTRARVRSAGTLAGLELQPERRLPRPMDSPSRDNNVSKRDGRVQPLERMRARPMDSPTYARGEVRRGVQ